MTAPGELVVESHIAPESIQYLEDRLYEFNSAETGIDDGLGLGIFLRDESDIVVAGICGHTWGGCCEIRQLWVAENLRGRGVGTRLLAAAEREALRRGCSQLVLQTHSFQAPDFYARRGYETLAAVEDYPAGHRHILLRKRLRLSSGDPRT